MRLKVVSVMVVLFLTLQATPAFADGMPYWVLGRQYSTQYAGIVARVWAYNWVCGAGGAHVSSLYVDADGFGGNQNRYIEAGLYKSYQLATGGDQRPVFFSAYEDYPYTSSQNIYFYNRLALDQWHDVKIANYQPYVGAPSDWCTYVNGTFKFDAPNVGFYLGQPITASERKTIVDANYSSFDNIMSRQITGTHTEWTSIRYEDLDFGWKALPVNGSQWRCVVQ